MQQNVLFVSDTKSLLINSIKKQLEEYGYNVYLVAPNTDEMDKIKDHLGLILLYLDFSVGEDVKPYIYLRDRSIETDVPIWIIGNNETISSVERIIPKHSIQQRLLRPINVKDVSEQIHNFLKEESGKEKKKILVVDDSGTMLRSIKSWLGDKYQVALANSGTMAIKYLTLNRPDLVLLDYDMPICNGKQVFEMMKTESEFSDIPVIFLTGRSDKESVLEIVSLKPDGYLLKSTEPYLIVKSIQDFFVKQKNNLL